MSNKMLLFLANASGDQELQMYLQELQMYLQELQMYLQSLRVICMIAGGGGGGG